MTEKNTTLKERIEALYNGDSKRARSFRFGLLLFDIASILYFVGSSMVEQMPLFLVVDFLLGLVVLADLVARIWIEENRKALLSQFATWADIVVIVTLLAPYVLDSFLFLRVLRSLRLLRSYRVLRDLRRDFAYFRRNEEIIQSVINLGVFIFVVTALVYVLQHRSNDAINNYIDALYFTVTTLTTTGFGDITLHGSSGRLLAILVMVVGVALFLRLLQTLFRPQKVSHRCPDCGLTRHEADAVHCKHCGRTLDIETEGGF